MAKKNSGASKTGKPKPSGETASPETKRAEARHEAGHAVAAVLYRFEVYGIDIIPQVVPGTGGMMGKAGAEFGIPHIRTVVGKGEEAVIRILTMLYAGFLAEQKVNPNAALETGYPASDGDRARLYAMRRYRHSCLRGWEIQDEGRGHRPEQRPHRRLAETR